MHRLTLSASILAVVLPLQPAVGQTAPPDGGFSLPLQCRPGRDCWVVNYADVDPGPAAQDFTCGPRTFEGHKGTDLAIRDRTAMRAGKTVIAVADGVVLKRRDGMADTGSGGSRGGRECGNGIVMDHGGGWTSQYCHMRRESISVRPGQRVRRGAVLGLVGMSGVAEFPHIHLTLRRDGRVVDPFTGQALDAGCGRSGVPLWRPDASPGYDAGNLYAAGFATGRVSKKRILDDAGSPGLMSKAVPALVLWGAAFGVRKGDVLRLTVTGPGGGVMIDRRARIPRDRAWHIAFSGAKRPGAGWRTGRYQGVVRHLRGGKLMSARRIAVTLR